MASMEAEDTQASSEPLTQSKIKFRGCYMCFEEEIWKYFRLGCSQKKPHMHFPESICESTTTGQAISTDQSSKETEKKNQGNSLETEYFHIRKKERSKFVWISKQNSSEHNLLLPTEITLRLK